MLLLLLIVIVTIVTLNCIVIEEPPWGVVNKVFYCIALHCIVLYYCIPLLPKVSRDSTQDLKFAKFTTSMVAKDQLRVLHKTLFPPSLVSCLWYHLFLPSRISFLQAISNNKKKINRVFPATFFLWESLGLLQPKIEGPEEKSGVSTVTIKQRTRTKIKAVL